jgi:hypothetical protein
VSDAKSNSWFEERPERERDGEERLTVQVGEEMVSD